MAFPTKPLRECARLASGGTPSKANPTFWGGPIAWLTPKDMSRFDGTTQDSVTRGAIGNGTREASAESLFIAVRGMSLHNEIRVVRPKRKMAFNQDIKAITPVAAVDGRFLHYALLAKIPDLLDAVEAAGHGTGVLPTDKLNSLPIPDIPLSEQRAIAATLGALDGKIELNRKMNSTLDSMARALFRDWFVDFGPTRAKMAGTAPYLSDDLWSLFPDRLDDEGKPEGWEIRSLGDFADLKGGKQLEKEHISSTGPIPVFGGAGVMGFTANHNAEGFLISVGRVGAYCGQFFSHRGKAWINNNASLIRPNSDVSGEWLLIALRHIDMDVIKKGAAQPFVSNGDIAKVGIVWPGDAIIDAFSSALVSLMRKAETNERESDTLSQTRDLLLPRLMSGELRLAEASETLEAVL